MKDRLRVHLPLLGAILLALLPFREFLGSGVPVGRDLLFYFFPLKAHLVEAVTRGEMPWVDRYRWGGSPLLGAPSAAPFDPANVLFLVLPLGAAMKAWILLHLGLALAGFAAFARRLGLDRAPAAVAGLVFALGGTTVSLAAFPPTLSALSILPWFTAFVFDLVRAPGRRPTAAVAATAALILLATAPEFVFFASCVAVAVFVSEQGKDGTWRQGVRPLALLAASALLAAGLGAISLVPGAATAARSIRSPGGGMGPRTAAMKPLVLPRLPDLLVDGAVADWTVVATAPRVPDYPYLPSLTPGRVAWGLVLIGVLRKGPGRIAAAGLALLGILLALGDATPVLGLVVRTFPPLGWIRYPERHMVLAGFGFAWLAALGLSRLALTISPRALRIVLPLLALAVFLDREEMARRLSPVEDAAVLAQRPSLLDALPEVSEEAPPPRLFYNDAYQPIPIYDKRDIGAASRVGRETLLPAYASLFGFCYQFEVDYDLSLSAEAFEWTRLLTRAVPERPSLALRFIRGAGVSAIVKTRTRSGRTLPAASRADRERAPSVPVRDARRRVRRCALGLRTASRGRLFRRHGVRRRRAAGRSRLSRSGPDPLGGRPPLGAFPRRRGRRPGPGLPHALPPAGGRRGSDARRPSGPGFAGGVRVRGPSGGAGAPCFKIAARNALGEDRHVDLRPHGAYARRRPSRPAAPRHVSGAHELDASRSPPHRLVRRGGRFCRRRALGDSGVPVAGAYLPCRCGGRTSKRTRRWRPRP